MISRAPSQVGKIVLWYPVIVINGFMSWSRKSGYGYEITTRYGRLVGEGGFDRRVDFTYRKFKKVPK